MSGMCSIFMKEWIWDYVMAWGIETGSVPLHFSNLFQISAKLVKIVGRGERWTEKWSRAADEPLTGLSGFQTTRRR